MSRRKRTPEEQELVSRLVALVDEDLAAGRDRAGPPAPPGPPREPPDQLVADGRRWVRVAAPRPWRPKFEGDVLVARFLSRATRLGDGDRTFAVVTLGTDDGAVTISGVVIASLFDAAGDLQHGTPVRVVYKGTQTSAAGRPWKDFELWVEKEPGK